MHGLIGIKKYILIYRWAFEDVWIAVGYYIDKCGTKGDYTHRWTDAAQAPVSTTAYDIRISPAQTHILEFWETPRLRIQTNIYLPRCTSALSSLYNHASARGVWRYAYRPSLLLLLLFIYCLGVIRNVEKLSWPYGENIEVDECLCMLKITCPFGVELATVSFAVFVWLSA